MWDKPEDATEQEDLAVLSGPQKILGVWGVSEAICHSKSRDNRKPYPDKIDTRANRNRRQMTNNLGSGVRWVMNDNTSRHGVTQNKLHKWQE